MRKLLFLGMSTLFVFAACQKESFDKQIENQSTVVLSNSLSEWDAGEEHNSILDAYYAEHSVGDGTLLSTRIQFVHDYIQSVDSEASFNNFLDSNAQLIVCYNWIDNAEPSISYAQQFIDSLYNNNVMSYNVHANNSSLLQILEDVSNLSGTLSSINTLMGSIAQDNNLTTSEKELLKGVCQVAKASLEYWTEESFKTQASVPWYVKDTMAAMAATQTGMVAYATVATGGWGGLAVLVGSAAVGSCIP